MPQEDVFCCLLGDGTGAPFFLVRFVVLHGALYGLEVKAMVHEETLVLAGHDCHRQMLRYLFERHPFVLPSDLLPCRELLITPDEHQRCGVYRYEPVCDDSEYRGGKEKDDHPLEESENELEDEHEVWCKREL